LRDTTSRIAGCRAPKTFPASDVIVMLGDDPVDPEAHRPDTARRMLRYQRVRTINQEEVARDVVVVAASAGGIPAVIEILSYLPADLPAFLGVVIHRGRRAPADWSGMLARKARLRVVEPAAGDPLTRGFVYVAPTDANLVFVGDRVALDHTTKENYTRPAADPLFRSAALAYGPRVVGVVLTGCGSDGTKGLVEIARCGGLSLVQQPSEAAHPSMPASAIARDHVDASLTLAEIGQALVDLAWGRTSPSTSETG
jgi:two-component system, chemotaxis family, protein-glutamate methylesterase/glutaminase